MFNYIIIFQYLGTVFVPLSKIGGQSSLLFCYSIFLSCFCYFNDVSLVILDDETVHDNILLIFVFHKQWNIYTLSNQKQWFIFFCNKFFLVKFCFLTLTLSFYTHWGNLTLSCSSSIVLLFIKHVSSYFSHIYLKDAIVWHDISYKMKRNTIPIFRFVVNTKMLTHTTCT